MTITWFTKHMGHNTCDTQQSLYYVNVYIIYYLIFSTYLKIARESNTNNKIGFNLLKLIENFIFFVKSRHPFFSCSKVNFFNWCFSIDYFSSVWFSNMFPKFQMDSQQAPNNVPYCIPYTICLMFNYCKLFCPHTHAQK
jgi:hypothetical protein